IAETEVVAAVQAVALLIQEATKAQDVAASGQETVLKDQCDSNGNHEHDGAKKNRIQVSNTKKPLFFYVNLAKRFMQQYDEVELSALGMAIATVVTVVEILKNNGLAIEKKISTSTIDIGDESRGRPVQKAKMEILLRKSDQFDELMEAAATEDLETGEDLDS
ncbi:unnamed protein product, partial [Sphagnum tenellum]